jgi:hypothetical protein
MNPDLDPRCAANCVSAKPSVVLVGFQKMGNLGLGYLSAVLRRAGFSVHLIDIETEPKQICATIVAIGPILVGFSNSQETGRGTESRGQAR